MKLISKAFILIVAMAVAIAWGSCSHANNSVDPGAGPSASDSGNPISVDSFSLQTTVPKAGQLHIKLKSELPDGVPISVAIYRLCDVVDEVTKKIDKEMVYYVDEKVMSQELKAGITRDVSDAAIKSALEEKRQRFSVTDLKLLPKTLSKTVFVDTTAATPAVSHLSGAAFKEGTLGKYLSTKSEANLNTVSVKGGASLKASALSLGHKYYTAQESTPLMGSVSDGGGMAALLRTRTLPQGTPFTPLQSTVDKNGDVWYRVKAEIGVLEIEGWLNSLAISKKGAIKD